MRRVGKQKVITLALKILLPVACCLWIAFIFTNSLQAGGESSSQSAAVVETVQRVAQAIAPESTIANATGEAYDKLHSAVRACAHVTEFAVLGLLLGWCYFAYTLNWKLYFIPLLGALLVALLDEWLQTFVDGRAWEVTDLLLDSLGGLAGVVFAALSVVLGLLIYEKRMLKKE